MHVNNRKPKRTKGGDKILKEPIDPAIRASLYMKEMIAIETKYISDLTS